MLASISICSFELKSKSVVDMAPNAKLCLITFTMELADAENPKRFAILQEKLKLTEFCVTIFAGIVTIGWDPVI